MKILSKAFLAFVLLLVSTGLNNAGTGKFKSGAYTHSNADTYTHANAGATD